MGVRGLQSYIDKQCPYVKQDICIFDLANQHRHFINIMPKLVVDGMAFIHSLYDKAGNLEWIYGGQWIEYSNLLLQFCKTYQDRDIKLAFFFDGSIVNDKHPEWVRSQIQRSGPIAALFDHLRTYQPLTKEFEKLQMPTCMATLTSMAIKVLCPEVEVYKTLNDVYIEIADYARKNKDVFGILSNNSDFIIFNSKPYLSSRELDFTTMCTILYDRRQLSQHLSIPLRQFPLLACLLGNDFITRDTLSKLYRQLRTYRRPSLPDAISSFINDHLYQGREYWENHDLGEHELTVFSNEICGNDRLKEDLSRAIASYTEFHLPVVPSCIIGQHSNDCTIASIIFVIYSQHKWRSGEILEDYKDTSLPYSYLAYRPLRRRIYAIIFNNMRRNKSTNEDIAVDEWCAYNGSKLEKPEYIDPLYVPNLENVPPLEELWQLNFASRLKYFVACLQTNLTEVIIQSVEPKFAMLCCVINYLLTNFECPLLKKFEIAAFIAQAVYIQNKTPQEIHAIEGPSVETRAIHLCSLFMSGVGIMIVALGVCGYPISREDAMPWNYFDGKVFHKMYGLTKKATPIQNLKGWKESSVDLFNKLYNKATVGVNI